MTIRISLTSVLVDDQDKALAFYTDVLGFAVKHNVPVGDDRWITVVSPADPGGPELLLEPMGIAAARTFQAELFKAGIPLTAFSVDDIDNEYERMRGLGVVFRFGPQAMGPGAPTAAMFEDTCGNLIQIFQRPADEGYGTRVDKGTVRFERMLPGPIERVWSYLADSDKRALWLASGVIPPRVGDDFSLRFDHASLSPDKVPTPQRFKFCEGGITSEHHKVLRFEPPHVLAITWDENPTPSEVTFELYAVGDKVRLVLTHSRLPDVKEMVNVSGGWHTHLRFLEGQLEGRAMPSFWTLFDGIEGEYGKRFAVGAAKDEQSQ